MAEKLKEIEDSLERASKKQKVYYTKALTEIDKILGELNKAKLLLNAGMLQLQQMKNHCLYFHAD